MTPQDKAIELVKKLCYAAGSYINDLVFGIAKRGAMICVDEIIQSLKQYGTLVENVTPQWIEPDIEYWEEVKKGIQSL